MANRKISDLTALTAPATGDLLPIVDISEAAAADKNKKITINELFASIPAGTAAAPSVAFEGYPGTGVYSSGADQVAISTNGTSRIVVDASGNVSIDGNTFYVDAANNRVGIGTSGPGVKLEARDSITGGSDGTIATLHNFSDTGGDTRYAGLNFRIGSDNGTSAIRAARTLSSADFRTELSFWTNPTGATQTPVRAMTIDYLRRVGIGTTGPGGTLDIKAAASTAPLIVQGPSSEFARIDSSGRLLVGTSDSSMSGGTVQQNGNLGIIANNATNLPNNGTLDIVINSAGSCYSGFLIVENTLVSSATTRTQATYSVLGRGTSATATSIATLNGSTAAASFTLTYPSNGTIRITNTCGADTNVNLVWFGPTGY